LTGDHRCRGWGRSIVSDIRTSRSRYGNRYQDGDR